MIAQKGCDLFCKTFLLSPINPHANCLHARPDAYADNARQSDAVSDFVGDHLKMSVPSEVALNMRPKQAAEYTGLSENHLAQMRISGEGPIFVKAGRFVIYRRVDVDAWIASRRRRSTSDLGAQAA